MNGGIVALGLALLISAWLAWTGVALWRKATAGVSCSNLSPGQNRRLARYHFLGAVVAGARAAAFPA